MKIKSISWILLGLAACSSAEEKAARAGAQAMQAYQAGDLARARLSSLEAIGYKDDVADYWLLLGRTSLETGQLGAAYSAYNRAIELDRSNPEALLGLAQLSLAAGKPDDAVTYSDQLLLIVPEHPGAILVKGFVALKNGNFAEAMKRADEVLARSQNDEAGLILKARVLSASGKQGDAAQLIEGALSTSAPTTAKLEALLEIYKRSRNRIGLRRTYQRMIALNPRNAAIEDEYLRYLFTAGAVEDGLAYLKPRLVSDRAARLATSVAAAPAGAISASQFLELAGEASPNGKAAIAAVALDRGFPAEASRILEPFSRSEIEVGTATPIALYATAQYRLGHAATARELVARVLEFDPTNPRGLQLRLLLALDRRDFDAALGDAGALVRDHPKQFEYRALLAEVYRRKGDNALAKLTFRKAFHDLPGNPAAAAAYETFLKSSGDLSEAAEVEAESSGR